MQIRVCWRIKLVLQCLLVCGLALQSPVAAPKQMKQVIEVNHGSLLVSMLEPDLAKNYTVRCYLAGHIMYTDPRVRHELSRDIPSFVRAVLSTGG